MATQIPVHELHDQAARSPRRLWLEVLHDWVTTVDHKKIGLMYIGYALLFLVIAGFEALLMRIQLAVPNNHFVSPEAFNAYSPCTERPWCSSSGCRYCLALEITLSR